MADRGRPRKYQTPEELERAVDAYFAAISYQEPAVVATPTGEVDEKGRVQWKTRMLREPGAEPGQVGRPVTVTKWLKPPGVAGLCLALGISRDTWWRYAKRPGYRDVAERARLRMEEYWTGRLETRAARGAAFALVNAFGWSGTWKNRQEADRDGEGQKAGSVEEFLRREARKDGGEYVY